MNQINPGTQEILSNFEEQVSFADLWLVVKKYKAVIISIVIVAVITAILYALSLPAIYRATVLMAQSAGTPQISGAIREFSRFSDLTSLAGIGVNVPEQNATENQIAMARMKSRTFTNQFIKENNLLPILFVDDWDKEKGEWKNDKTPSYWDSYNAFKDVSNISTDTEGMVHLSVGMDRSSNRC